MKQDLEQGLFAYDNILGKGDLKGDFFQIQHNKSKYFRALDVSITL